MNTPLVSVVMPAYNGEKYIGEAIESVLNQTYSNWELVIVEDCSTDSTLKVIREYRDERIKLLCNTENMGIAATTNKAIENSSGKYIALLDDDDVSETERLQLQVDYLESHPEIDILGGGFSRIDGESRFTGYHREPRRNPNYIKAMLLLGNLDFANSTAMIRSDFLKNNHLSYKENCYGMQDYRFYIDASKVGKISSIPNFLLRYRVHDENETKRNQRECTEQRARCYSEFIMDSLTKSGYAFNEEEENILCRFVTASGTGFRTKEEADSLQKVFGILLKQAKEMQIDYYDELTHVCKMKFVRAIMKTNLNDVQCSLH